MIIDKSIYPWLLNRMYNKTHLNLYGQYPLGIRLHLGIIDNHEEMKKAYESNDEFYIDDYMKVKVSTKNSFAPYLSVISRKYFKSGSPSIKRVSDDASSLKSFEKYPNPNNAIINTIKIALGFFRTIF